MQYFYDDINQIATLEDTGCLLYKGVDNDLYIESWLVDEEQNIAIEYAYTISTPTVGYDRIAHFKKHNVNPRFLRSIIVPIDVYGE